jgi:hypothetical protein
MLRTGERWGCWASAGAVERTANQAIRKARRMCAFIAQKHNLTRARSDVVSASRQLVPAGRPVRAPPSATATRSRPPPVRPGDETEIIRRRNRLIPFPRRRTPCDGWERSVGWTHSSRSRSDCRRPAVLHHERGRRRSGPVRSFQRSPADSDRAGGQASTRAQPADPGADGDWMAGVDRAPR